MRKKLKGYFDMKTKFASVLVLATIALAGCSGTKEKLGLTKKAPDEFAVVKRAPLSMPPDYTLRPPRPGAPRPQEQSPQEEARQNLFGNGDGTAVQEQYSGNDAAFLSQAGARSEPGIRQKVDAETAIINEDEQPVVQKLMGKPPSEAPQSVVDPKAEAERLKQNKEQGKPVTEGETPAVEQ
jgi:hypothetical protein